MIVIEQIRQGRTDARGNDHGDGGRDLQAEAARVGHLDALDAQHAHDLVPISCKTDNNTSAADDQNPDGHLRNEAQGIMPQLLDRDNKVIVALTGSSSVVLPDRLSSICNMT